MAELAKALGLQKSNFLAALAGRRPLPERSLASLPEVIGLDAGGGLTTTQVHRWKVRDIHDLTLVLETWVTSVDLRPTQGEAQPDALPPTAWILSARRITDNAQIVGILLGLALAQTDGHSDVIRHGNAVRVSDVERFRTAHAGVDEISALLTENLHPEAKCTTWSDFIRTASEWGFDPQSALRALEVFQSNPSGIAPIDR